MGLRRTTHRGKSRQIVRGQKGGKLPAITDGVPFFSFQNFPWIRKQLVEAVRGCKHRKDTGTITTEPCCRVEQGRVYHCNLYDHYPAKLYDCLNCQKRFAIDKEAQWIQPLVQLSQGLEPPQSLPGVQSALASDDPSTGVVKELPGHLGGS